MAVELDEQVRNLVRTILTSRDFVGRDELLSQADRLRVTGGPVTMLGLAVDADARWSGSVSPVPVTAIVADDAERTIGTLVLWLDDGYLSAFEYGWFSEDPPQTLPRPSQLRFDRS